MNCQDSSLFRQSLSGCGSLRDTQYLCVVCTIQLGATDIPVLMYNLSLQSPFRHHYHDGVRRTLCSLVRILVEARPDSPGPNANPSVSNVATRLTSLPHGLSSYVFRPVCLQGRGSR